MVKLSGSSKKKILVSIELIRGGSSEIYPLFTSPTWFGIARSYFLFQTSSLFRTLVLLELMADMARKRFLFYLE